MPTAHEHLTERFRKWEMRGRGWRVFDEPVWPEPPFVPFQRHELPETPAVDDGRRPTLFSSLVRRLSQKISTDPPVATAIPEPEEEPGPVPLVRKPLVELQTSLPAKLDIAPEIFGQLLQNLSLCQEPLTFELFGTEKKVTAQFVACEDDAPAVRRQLQAHFPDAAFRPSHGVLEGAWIASVGEEMLAVEFGLEREFMFPLASGKLDPFVGIIGALSELGVGELGLFQVIWQPVQHPWNESIVRSVTHEDGRPFFVNTPELTAAAEEKASHPLFAAVLRIAARADDFERTVAIARDLASSLRVFAKPDGNALVPLRNDEYAFEEHIEDVLSRQSRRPGMILTSDELIGFVHLPSSAVRSPILERDTGKTKAAPEIVRGPDGVVIGNNEHAGETVPVCLTPDQLSRHTHIIGASGTGKSSLLFNMIRQDLENGAGVAVLDPHGDLIEQILGIIPEERINDVVLVDPSDVEFPIGFNILQAHSEEEKNLIASDLVSVFRRLSTSWGDQMNTVLQNAILVFLESPQGGTLADVRRFLLEKPFHNQFLETVQDPELVYYWREVFPKLTGGKSIGPILTRLQDFFSREPIRNMVSQRGNKLDFARIMDEGRIFLAKLSEGLCGTENSYLLGTLLVSKFQQLAMARQSQAAAQRRPFWLYIDEFDHFITPSMAEILKGARKYRLGLTLAHQELHQLQADSKVASAVATHPCTRIVFRVGDDDAKRLGEGFESFDAKSLKTLEKFHAIVRVERNDWDFNIALRKPDLPGSGEATARRERIVSASRAKYAIPRAEVEAALQQAWNARQPNPTPLNPPPTPPKLPPSPSPVVHPSAEASKVAEVPKDTVSEKEEAAPLVVMPQPPKRERAQPAERREPGPPRNMGRGGKEHQAIQKRIKQAAEELGFRSVIEKPVLDGGGSVDLWLERQGQAIGCEISFTTSVEHEVENVKKCLQAGIPQVAVICVDEQRLRKIADVVARSLGNEASQRVICCHPDQFIAHLQTLSIPPPAVTPSVKVVKGYKVKHSATPLNAEEQKQREEAAIKSIAETMKKKSA